MFCRSGVRVKKIDIDLESGIVTADIKVSANGKSDVIKNQQYAMFGLQTWLNALVKSA
jgi:hypothetical protein